jgi:starch phosphorylase
LIFSDLDRFGQMLRDEEQPVQIFFSGKAHPADDAGKEYIQAIVNIARMPEYWDRVGFIEDYDMNIARYLVQGVDLWLNNPRRPREASGTSGQKAAMNGNPNLSVLDGWWVEGYNGHNGWAIGEERAYMDETTQDEADAYSLYRLLENEIIPLYYARDEHGVPHGWIQMAKAAMQTSLWDFSARRMVRDYTTQMYAPAASHGARFQANNFAVSRQFAAWLHNVEEHWPEVALVAQGPDETQFTIGDDARVSARLSLGSLQPDDVAVEIVFGEELGDRPDNPQATPMSLVQRDRDGTYLYQGTFMPRTTGALIYGVRVRPNHPDMLNPHETKLVTWAG